MFALEAGAPTVNVLDATDAQAHLQCSNELRFELGFLDHCMAESGSERISFAQERPSDDWVNTDTLYQFRSVGP